MRRTTPAAGPRRAGYPRLAQAWRLLIGAAPLAFSPSLAMADATLPTPPPQKNVAPPHVERAKSRTPRLMGDIVAVEPPGPPPSAKRTRPERQPMLMGGPMYVAPPLAPGEKFKPEPVRPPDHTHEEHTARDDEVLFRLDADGALVLHPHGPGEPCIHFGPKRRV